MKCAGIFPSQKSPLDICAAVLVQTPGYPPPPLDSASTQQCWYRHQDLSGHRISLSSTGQCIHAAVLVQTPGFVRAQDIPLLHWIVHPRSSVGTDTRICQGTGYPPPPLDSASTQQCWHRHQDLSGHRISPSSTG